MSTKPPDGIAVDHVWYLSHYPDVRVAITLGEIKSAQEHFILYGYQEGRLPIRPWVDEAWYVATYHDVAEGIRSEQFLSAFEHYTQVGYREGRKPNKYAAR